MCTVLVNGCPSRQQIDVHICVTSDLLGRNAYTVTVSNPTNDWLNIAELPISWDAAALGGSQVFVDILLVGYRQEGNPGQEQVREASYFSFIT